MTTTELLAHPIVISLAVVLVASAAMGLFSSNKHFPIEGRTVLITGGSSAISADCTSPEDNTRILAETTSWNNSQAPDIVWANAGSSSPGLFIDTSLETHRSQMDTNYWASFYLAHATLKLWLAPQQKKEHNKTRHFIITSSSVAFVGVAGYSPYAPAKAALKSLADSLRMELNLYNGSMKSSLPSPAAATQIHLVCPGTILTPGYDAENATKHPVTKILESGDPKQTGDEVADAALKGLQRESPAHGEAGVRIYQQRVFTKYK
ncbi:unnamed protein product, partial [Aureobasidium vineae]